MTSQKRPSDAQQRYLRTLARQTGTSFNTPATSAEASREIQRLKRLKSTGTNGMTFAELANEAPAPAATTFTDSETQGSGSTATWA